MRAFAWFFGLILLGLAGIAALAWPLYELVTPTIDAPFHRVASRTGMLILLIGFIVVARRLALSDRASLGYGLPRRQFFAEAAIGLALGVATMLPIVLIMIALDLRMLREGVVLDVATFAHLALKGLTSGIAVALIEETFLRGAMHSGIQRESGARLAVLLTALVYSATHFIGKYRIAADQVGPGSGLDLLAGSLAKFGDPAAMADAFLCLFAVGVLLGMVRTLTGNIAACIGLHAGWVWVITFVRETSLRDESSPLAFLLSTFDGMVGWLVLGWTLVIGGALWWFYRRRGRRGAPFAEGARA
jgi:membrane protease YdiL (CAAX protease family)